MSGTGRGARHAPRGVPRWGNQGSTRAADGSALPHDPPLLRARTPCSGPVRYDYVDGWWLYLRDGHELHARLRQELRELTGRDPELEAGGAGD